MFLSFLKATPFLNKQTQLRLSKYNYEDRRSLNLPRMSWARDLGTAVTKDFEDCLNWTPGNPIKQLGEPSNKL